MGKKNQRHFPVFNRIIQVLSVGIVADSHRHIAERRRDLMAEISAPREVGLPLTLADCAEDTILTGDQIRIIKIIFLRLNNQNARTAFFK